MITAKDTILVVIDIQGNLAEIVHDKDLIYHHVQSLIKAAKLLNIPTLLTEQAPHKIGYTIPLIKDLLKETNSIEKSTFSCVGEENFLIKLKSLNRKQIIITGIEAHVCVYQTVADLIKMNFDVHIVEDAITARLERNKKIAIARMRQMGAIITCTEMLVTELLQSAKHPHFKELLQLIK